MHLAIFFTFLGIVVVFVAALDNAALFTVYMNALGMGVASKAKSTAFYTKTLGIKKSMSMPVADMGQGGWTEDINMVSGEHSSALVIMEWSDKRNFKNLPIKLTFAVEDPAEKQQLIAKSGGQALDLKTEANPEAIYAKDLDGYLIELVSGKGAPALRSVGVGVSNLNASATWWSGATGLPLAPLKEAKEWNTISLQSSKGSELMFMEWHETPKRPTKNMPIKLVFASSSTSDFSKSIQKQSPKGSPAGAISMFQFEPLE
jgi:catechol 2,3-dioxygenase-like lactoylglutathione lyase family enzyme